MDRDVEVRRDPRFPRLRPSDRVRLVSPASFPSTDWLTSCCEVLESWGLRVEVGKHALDEWGYMAGHDCDRLADVNEALQDPGVRAVIATRGGAGAYRIVDGIDLDAVRSDPKPVVGFSDITNLHLALVAGSAIASVHGSLGGERSRATVRHALMSTDPAVLRRCDRSYTATIRFGGSATGRLIGGNLPTIIGFVGAGLPSLDGAILLLEAERTIGLGQVDRQLTHLIRSGVLRGLKGVVLGRFTGFDDYSDRGWTLHDVLNERLAQLAVPVLGGIEVGHGEDPEAVTLGTSATIDVDAGTLTVTSGAH